MNNAQELLQENIAEQKCVLAEMREGYSDLEEIFDQANLVADLERHLAAVLKRCATN